MRGVSELTATIVGLAILISSTAGILAYYNGLMDRGWYEAKHMAQSESYRYGVKVVALDKRGNKIWLYNYGWNEAFVEAVEVDSCNSTSWCILHAINNEKLSGIPPRVLVILALDRDGEDIKIYLKGGLRIQV